MRYPGQNIGKQPFVCVTVSTRKAAGNIISFTIYSALNPLTNKFHKVYKQTQPPKLGH